MTSFLYVEDDQLCREIMELTLVRGMGYSQVVIFEDSKEFLPRVEGLSPTPDIIFLDIHVKPHNGFDMLRMLREREEFQFTPIIAITASVMNEEVKRLKEAGFNGAIAKPVDIDTLPEILELILQGQEVWRVR